MSRPIKVLIVDDHRLMRIGIRHLLEDLSGIELLDEDANNGEEAMELARIHEVDVVLMDVNMPGIGGLEATQRIVSRNPDVKVIALSMHMENPFPARLIEAGASGYLGKDCSAEELSTAIRTVSEGGQYVAPSIAGRLAMQIIKGNKTDFDLLSKRETQIMLLVTEGQGNNDISVALNLSPKTVSTYRTRIYEKLGVSSDVELTRMAIRYGVIDEQKVGNASI